MRRKYDLRNKRNFVIILILAIFVIGIFSLFIYKYQHTSRIEYAINTGSIIQDNSKNFIDVSEDALLRMRWNDNYYLVYQDKKVNLGKKIIVYDTVSSSMKLYGKYYEIDKTGKVIECNDETKIANTTETKFYKLDDREYLLIDRQIVSDDRSIEASNYLLVELDKMGNAKLSNNKLNLKTINPTTLVTSEYTFDINNEILKYGNLNIDLKKIIGSTNQYTPEEKKEDNTQGNNGNMQGTVGEGNGISGTGMAGVGNVINNTDIGNVTDIGEIKDKTKMTSIVRIQEGLTQIDVDYVVYDPYNEYTSVYAEIAKPGKIEVVYLSKNDTHIVFDNLIANTEYRINFIYTTTNEETGTIVPNTFDSVTLKTKMPTYNISIYKVSNVSNKLTYKVTMQEGYPVDMVNVSLKFDYRETNPETGESVIKEANIPSSVSVVDGSKTVIGTFDITGYDIDKGTLMTLGIDSVSGEYGTLDVDSIYTFRLGR